MLQLKDITKSYPVAGGEVSALKGISINFRKNEFVSILGASGCGKTTLLNIIGGLDKYTSGDLVIAGKSTKEYNDRDWDAYRNHSIGFIFQSYHLIPHQTILQNVELALTISGVSKAERRQRAVEALKKVGLDEKLNVRPNQLSGGQAQRVAIARALINDPEIVLADEPTGALDSKTSVQIMELLKEISRDRLVIMVTHNPELAEKYSTRIIRLLDGLVTDDTMPYDGEEPTNEKADEQPAERADFEDISGDTPAQQEDESPQNGKKNKSAMSVGMAFSLSLKNLLSKGKRTAMVSVAGSIGIIGVSMVLAISSGVRGFIASMENDLLSGYPLSVEETAIDYEALTSFATTSNQKADPFRLKDKVYVNSLLDTLIGFKGLTVTNTITEDYVSYVNSMPKEYYNALTYGYDFDMSNYIYTDFKVTDGEIDPALDTSGNYSVAGIRAIYSSVLKQQPQYGQYAGMISTISSFDELPDNSSYVLSQYDILATASGKTQKQLSKEEIAEIFESEDSIIMVVSKNAFSDLNFGQYGYMTEEEFLNFAYKSAGDEYDQSIIDKYNGKINPDGTYDENFQGTDFSLFVGENAKTFSWYPNDTVFTKNPLYGTVDGMPPFIYNPSSADFNKEEGTTLKVKAILQKKEGISYGCMSSGLYYTKALSQKTVKHGVTSKIAQFINGLPTEDEDGNKIEQALEALPYTYSYTYVKDGEWKKANAAMAIVSPVNM
ncbi:MAG: ABC transporter ATP-binding protein, partial [Clostridia bacterium]|nr:ABC transporter ATP-binding protein [Clostridia bacterium]